MAAGRTRSAQRALLATLLLASLVTVGACSSTEELPVEPGALEPGYPAYTPPDPVDPADPGPDEQEPDGEAESAPSTPAATPTSPASTRSPGSGQTARPTPRPGATARPTSAASPAPDQPGRTQQPTTPGAGPGSGAGSGATTPAPTATTAPPAPVTPSPTPAPTTPTVATLNPTAWAPSCGAPLTAPATSGQVGIAVDALGSVEVGGLLSPGATVSSLLDVPLAAERYYTSVAIARDGVVVSRSPGGSEASPLTAIAAGASIPAPVVHDLTEDCISAESALPPGSYTALVTLHVLRDGGDGGVVAAGPVQPFTITGPDRPAMVPPAPEPPDQPVA